MPRHILMSELIIRLKVYLSYPTAFLQLQLDSRWHKQMDLCTNTC